MLELDLNLEREMTVHQGVRKRFTPHYKIYNENKARAFQTILDKFFFYKENTLIPSVCNIFNYRALYKYLLF